MDPFSTHLLWYRPIHIRSLVTNHIGNVYDINKHRDRGIGRLDGWLFATHSKISLEKNGPPVPLRLWSWWWWLGIDRSAYLPSSPTDQLDAWDQPVPAAWDASGRLDDSATFVGRLPRPGLDSGRGFLAVDHLNPKGKPIF